jgi:hypothetical protein
MAPSSQNVVTGKAEFRKAEKKQNPILSRKPEREKNPGSLSRDYVQQERSKDVFCEKQKPGSYRSRSELFLGKDDAKQTSAKDKPEEIRSTGFGLSVPPHP